MGNLTMPRPSNTQERRHQIVQGLLSVMASGGYEGATTKAIAEAAGLTSGLVHYHFRNKQEILLAAIDELERRLESRYQAFLTEASTPEQRLLAFIDARLAPGEGADPEAVASWVTIGVEAVHQPEVKAAYQESLQSQQETLIKSIKAIGKRKHLAPKAVKELAALVMATMEGTFQLSISAREIMPKGYAAKTLLAVLEAYLGRTLRSDKAGG